MKLRKSAGGFISGLRNVRVLSREEIHDIAVQYVKTDDPKLAEKLVMSQLRLVVQLVRSYDRGDDQMDDLVQEGILGLMQAVKKYDPHRGIALTTYAAWWVRAYINRYLTENYRLVRFGTTSEQRRMFSHEARVRARLEAQGKRATSETIGEVLGIRPEVVESALGRMRAADASIDGMMRDKTGDEYYILDRMREDQPDVDEIVEAKLEHDNACAAVGQFMASLSEREQIIFRDRMLSDTYGERRRGSTTKGSTPARESTLQYIADRLGLSRERVRQIEVVIKRKLAEFLRNRDERPSLAAAPPYGPEAEDVGSLGNTMSRLNEVEVDATRARALISTAQTDFSRGCASSSA